jgi:hypothetical protein
MLSSQERHPQRITKIEYIIVKIAKWWTDVQPEAPSGKKQAKDSGSVRSASVMSISGQGFRHGATARVTETKTIKYWSKIALCALSPRVIVPRKMRYQYCQRLADQSIPPEFFFSGRRKKNKYGEQDQGAA